MSKSTMRKKFDKKGYSPSAYAKAHDISRETLYAVLNGKYDGSKSSQKGKTRKTIMLLKNDGIWIGPLPWERQDGVS